MFASLVVKPQSRSAAGAKRAHQEPTSHCKGGVGQPCHNQPLWLGRPNSLENTARFAAPLERIRASRVPLLLGPIQAKLAVGSLSDPLEDEADRVADQVMRMPSPEIAPTAGPPQISRKCAACEEEQGLQKKEAGIAEPDQSEAPASVYEVLRSPGQPLDEAIRAYFEPRFGHDFSQVRVHSGTTAEQSAKDVNARAYTVGHNIVFGSGRPAFGTHAGRRLIAHELAHVVQQSRFGASRGWNAAGKTITRQRTGVKLQKLVMTKEPAGGCGICYGEIWSKSEAPRAAGTVAHTVIQGAFTAMLSALGLRLVNFPYRSPTGETRFPDLAIATPRGLKIGEIKPANQAGEEEGREKLDLYKTTLQAAYPNSLIEMLDVGVAGSGLPMPDLLAFLSGCQSQKIGVGTTIPGLYQYWCDPPYSEARRRCRCLPRIPVPWPVREPVPASKPARVPGSPAGRYTTGGRPAEAPSPGIPPLVPAALATILAYAGIKLSPRLIPFITRAAGALGSLAPRVALAEAGTGVAVAEAATPAIAASAPTVATAGVGAASVGGSLVAILGTGYVLAHAGDVVEGAVAAALDEYYVQMDAAAAKIAQWYEKTQIAESKVEDLLYSFQSIVSANSELRGVMRPLHEAVREAARIIDRARFEMQAIANLIKPDVDLPEQEFNIINSLMRSGSYPPLNSPDLAAIASFLTAAADKITSLIPRLHTAREYIIAAQALYELKRH